MHARIREYLEADHARLSGHLEAAGASASVDFGAYQLFRAGLLRHIGIEEKILFQAVRGRSAQDEHLAVARQLHMDHAALAALLAPTPTPEILRRIRALLTLHNALEEGPDGFYATCESSVGTDAGALCYERVVRAPPVRLAPFRDGPKQAESIARLLLAAGRA